MLKKNIALIGLVSVIALAGCGGESTDSYLEIRGSDTMVNLGQQWAEAYMDEHPEASLSVTGGGSGTGIAALINNTVHIAQSSRAITAEEIQSAKDNNVEVHEFIVAQDAISVIVHNDNPLTQITMSQLKDVFTGNITQWSQLGWEEGGEITLYSRQSNSGTYVFFWETVMNKADWADSTMFMPGTSAIYEGVSTDKNSIGYVGVAYVRENVHALDVGRTEAGPFITPMVRANVDNGSYPIARPLFFYMNGTPSGAVLDYLKWVLSADGVKVLEEVGFYRITAEYKAVNDNTFQQLGIK